jgi:hypothetical protein
MSDDQNQAADTSEVADARVPRVVWNDKDARTTYANAVNAISTMEEVAIFFGVNKNWSPGDGNLEVELSDRIVLNPHAAKRLWTILGAVLTQYETRFGELKVAAPQENTASPVNHTNGSG